MQFFIITLIIFNSISQIQVGARRWDLIQSRFDFFAQDITEFK